jgi:hypothetical protein
MENAWDSSNFALALISSTYGQIEDLDPYLWSFLCHARTATRAYCREFLVSNLAQSLHWQIAAQVYFILGSFSMIMYPVLATTIWCLTQRIHLHCLLRAR